MVPFSDDRARNASVLHATRRHAAASILRALELQEQGRFDEAADQCAAVLADQPENAEALRVYGVVQFQRGKLSEAEVLTRRASTLLAEPIALANLGSILALQGQKKEALEQYQAALQIDAGHLQSLVHMGNTLLEIGRYEEALSAYNRALKISPMLLDALCNRGNALRALGRHREALQTYDQALTVDPRAFEAHCNRGNVLRDLQRYAEALQSYELALGIVPDNLSVLSLRGRTLVDLGRPAEGLTSFNEAVAIKPDFVEGLYNSAVALERLGRAAESLRRCDRVLALESHHVKAIATRGNALMQLERYEDAVSDYDLALVIEPNVASVLCNRGTALRSMRLGAQALQSYDAALAANPDFPEAWCFRANVLQDAFRYADALESLDRAVELRPNYAGAWLNKGNVLAEMSRADEALQAYERAIAIDPNFAEAQFAKGCLCLHQGDFALGWPQYEWRQRLPAASASARFFPQPLWLGEAPLEGQTILVHAEQGLGDTLQFARYVPHLSKRGAQVLLEVQPSLKRLMQALDGNVRVFATGEALPAFDFHCPLLSLPLAFRTEEKTIPADTPYLRAEPPRLSEWHRALGEKRRPRVGIAWSGNPKHRNDLQRSVSLTSLKPLVELNVEWISLQKDVRSSDLLELESAGVRRFDDEIHDFSDSAALVQALDLVITVDTAAAHLAGALNCPVWILLAHQSEWRWMNGRESSPWYPSARLFRQTQAGRWDDVVSAIRHELGKRL